MIYTRYMLALTLSGCSWLSDIKCNTSVDCSSGICANGICVGGILSANVTAEWCKDHVIPGTEYKQRFPLYHNGKEYDCHAVLPMAKCSITREHPGSDRAIGPEYLEGPECEQWKKDSGGCEL